MILSVTHIYNHRSSKCRIDNCKRMTKGEKPSESNLTTTAGPSRHHRTLTTDVQTIRSTSYEPGKVQHHPNPHSPLPSEQ